jgi:hypothetical protein
VGYVPAVPISPSILTALLFRAAFLLATMALFAPGVGLGAGRTITVEVEDGEDDQPLAADAARVRNAREKGCSVPWPWHDPASRDVGGRPPAVQRRLVEDRFCPGEPTVRGVHPFVAIRRGIPRLKSGDPPWRATLLA